MRLLPGKLIKLGIQEIRKIWPHEEKELSPWIADNIDALNDTLNLQIEIEGKDLPRAISREYTLSLHKKANLRADLESWRGKGFTDRELEGFDLENILGKNCMLNIIHKQTEKAIYANIVSVMPLMKNMQKTRI